MIAATNKQNKMCKHTAWLSLVTGSHGTMLLDFNRLQALLHLFPDPSTQTPSLITFVGGRCKTRTVRKLISSEASNIQDHADIHLHVYPPTMAHDSPFLLADYTFPTQILPEQNYSNVNCHEIFRRSLSWTNNSAQVLGTVAESVLARLLVPFTDVICIFSSDFGGLVGVAGMLKALMCRGHIRHTSSTLPQVIRPTVFVVTENLTPRTDLVETQFLLEILQESFTGDIAAHFSCLSVLSIPPNKHRHQILLEHISRAVAEMQKRRKGTRNLFSLQHFAALFRPACDQFSSLKTTEYFNFVEFSRLRNPAPHAFTQHLTEFLGQLTSKMDIINSGVPLIASSILLDNNPPGMHGTSSHNIFQNLS